MDHHEAFEVLAGIVLGERHERPEDHERRRIVARQSEQQVLRRDAGLDRGDHLPGGLVAHRLHRGLADGIARVLRHRPRTGSVVELRRVAQAVAAPRIGLHPEQVLGIAEVLLQLHRRRFLGEQIGELLDVRLHDRIAAVDHVERDRAVVRIHHGLHRVPHVVERVAQVAAQRGRPGIGALRVRELRGGGVGVEHPLHLPVEHDRVGVVVVGQERRQQLNTLGDVAVVENPALALDLARHQQIRLGEAHREREAPEETADAHAVGAVVAGGLGAVVVVLEVDLGPLGAHDGVALQVLAHIQARLVERERLGTRSDHVRNVAQRIGRAAVGVHPVGRRGRHAVAVGVGDVLGLPGVGGQLGGAQLTGRQHDLGDLAVDLVAVHVDVAEVVEALDALGLLERVLHDGGVEQPHVAHRVEVVLDVFGGQLRLVPELALGDVVEPERDAGHLDVALDVGRFAGGL